MDNFIQFGRISQAVRAAAAKHGLKGDPFCEVPSGMFHSGSAELTAAKVYLDIPRAVRDVAPSAAMKMCRAVVYSYLRGAA